MLLLGTVPAWANNAWVVTDPSQLQFIDMEEGYSYLTKQFTKRFDILNAIRRAAARKMVKGWGLKKMPNKAKLEMGVVADASSGPLQFVIAIRGERFDAELLRKRLVEKYGNHLNRHEVTPAPQETQIAGFSTTVLPYIDRKGELVIVVADGKMLFASVLPGQYDLIERTAQVLANPDMQATSVPDKVRLTYQGYLTDEERRRIQEFFNRTITGKVKKFRNSFAKLYDDIDADVDEESFKTTNEKINDHFLKLESWATDLQYTKGGSSEDDYYQIAYNLTLPTAEEAQSMKELLLEKILFYKENARNEAAVLALDTVSLDVSDNIVTMAAEIDTKEGQYNYFFAYLAFLLSYTQTDRYLVVD